MNHPEPPQQTGGWDGDFATQAKHLLTREFFLETGRVLRPRGSLTVMTDNLWYGTFLLRIVSALIAEAEKGEEVGVSVGTGDAHLSDSIRQDKKNNKNKKNKPIAASTTVKPDFRLRSIPMKKNQRDWAAAGTSNPSQWAVQLEENGVTLYVGKPGAEAGHVVDASSYFDRLWKRGKLEERYFLVLKKKRADSSSSSVD